jgi:hypothetical protein
VSKADRCQTACPTAESDSGGVHRYRGRPKRVSLFQTSVARPNHRLKTSCKQEAESFLRGPWHNISCVSLNKSLQFIGKVKVCLLARPEDCHLLWLIGQNSPEADLRGLRELSSKRRPRKAKTCLKFICMLSPSALMPQYRPPEVYIFQFPRRRSPSTFHHNVLLLVIGLLRLESLSKPKIWISNPFARNLVLPLLCLQWAARLTTSPVAVGPRCKKR